MTIKDVLEITGGRTKVMIFSTDKNDSYIRLWNGIVDDIDFENLVTAISEALASGYRRLI